MSRGGVKVPQPVRKFKKPAALTVAIIERDFVKAALYCPPCLIHSYRWAPGDTALSLTSAWE